MLLAGLWLGLAASAQSQRNSIAMHTMLDSAGAARATTVRYYDGLGRLEEIVAAGASPSGADLVQFNARDRAGRIVRQYCAAPHSGGGGYATEGEVQNLATGAHGDSSPYTLTSYEQSPLGRKVAVTGPGQAWHSAGKAVKTEYMTNSATAGELKCRRILASDTRTAGDLAVTVTVAGFYPAASLYVTKTVDEDGRTGLVFVDKQGRTVLRRMKLDGGYADTYYVYDIAGNLTAVLPPALSETLGDGPMASSAEKATRYAYFYIHDWHGRCRAKKLPGREWQLTAYDSAGKAVMTQDGNMRRRGEAVFRLADAFGRECVQGIVQASLSLDGSNLGVVVLAERNASARGLGGYAVKDGTLPLAGASLLKVTYYDDYSFLDGKAFGPELACRNEKGYDRRYVCADYPAMSARGMLTGTATRILGDTAMLYKAVYYDHHGNVIQSHEQNALGGYDHYYYRLSFTGKPLAMRHEHVTATSRDVCDYSYTYDNMERLLTVSLSWGGASPRLLASNTRDELGRLQRQTLGAGGGAVDYSYNVRGWISAITSPHFKQTLHYADGYGGSTPCWSGDIGAIEWEAAETPAAAAPTRQLYRFGYDGLGRLVTALYSSQPAASNTPGVTIANGRDYSYSCRYGYDLNGNITSLHRKGLSEAVTTPESTVWTFGDIDDLSLAYSGNQLKKAADRADGLTYADAMDFKDGADRAEEYTYDANGNMTSDRNRGLHSIAYNVLNLPQTVRFADGHETRYTYDADGRKLRVEHLLNNVAVIDGEPGAWAGSLFAPASRAASTGGDTGIEPPVKTLTTRDYCGGHIYCNGTLERVLNDAGYRDSTGYHYYVKDYQGNVRAVVADDGTLEEVNSYYPYGMLHGPSAIAASVQPLKYGAKELDRQAGLDLYDSHARQLDPLLGRTTTQDPMAEKYSGLSPYLWCAGNPVRYTDPTGKRVELYATSLPGFDMPLATHTFIVVRDKQGKVKEYFAYGSEHDGIKGSYSGRLRRMSYPQDKMVYSGRNKEHLKKVITIAPPQGMSENEFDKLVTSVAKSFGNDNGITYFLAPSATDMTEGNCNTCTSTILLKSGVTQQRINEIKRELPGLSWGFSTYARPWTQQEQKDAVKFKQQCDSIYEIFINP